MSWFYTIIALNSY